MTKRPLSPIPNSVHKRQANGSSESSEYIAATTATWYTIGQCALTFELDHLALRAFEASLRHTPDHVDSLRCLSKVLRTTHQQQSVDVLASSFQKFPHLNNEPSLWKELAEAHISLKQYDQGHQAISRALQLRMNDPECLLIAGRCLEHLNPQHAQHTYQSILSMITQPTTHLELEIVRECHYKLGLLAAASSDWKTATYELQTAISIALQINAETELMWCTLASIRERAGDIESALQVCRDALQVVGLQRRTSVMAGYLAITPNKASQTDPEYAISILSPIVMTEKNDELDCLAWYLLGKAHSLNNNPRQAYDAFQCALKKGKTSPLPWLAVGTLYLKMGQLPDSLAAYSQAASLMVDDGSMTSAIASAAAWDGLACVYERCDDQAIDAADAYARAASCYRAADDLRAATQAEQRSHSLHAAARGEAPVPALRPVPETSPILLRDTVLNVIQAEQLKPLVPQEPQPQGKQFHHLPLPKGSLATAPASRSPTEKGTPQWRPHAPLHVSPSQMSQQPPIPQQQLSTSQHHTPQQAQAQPHHPQQHPPQQPPQHTQHPHPQQQHQQQPPPAQYPLPMPQHMQPMVQQQQPMHYYAPPANVVWR